MLNHLNQPEFRIPEFMVTFTFGLVVRCAASAVCVCVCFVHIVDSTIVWLIRMHARYTTYGVCCMHILYSTAIMYDLVRMLLFYLSDHDRFLLAPCFVLSFAVCFFILFNLYYVCVCVCFEVLLMIRARSKLSVMRCHSAALCRFRSLAIQSSPFSHQIEE